MTKPKTKLKSASNSASAPKKPRSTGAGSKPAPQAKRAHTPRTKAQQTETSATAKPARDTKLTRVLAMLRQPEGATLGAVMSAMGWLQHTTRAFMSAGGTPAKKHGVKIESFKNEKGERAYRIPASQGAQHV